MNQVSVSLIGGLTLGTTYALIALGLVLVYRTTGIFNLAHGELMLLAAYIVANWQRHHAGDFIVGLLLAALVTVLVAMLIYAVVLKWTVGYPHWVAFVATLVIGSVLDAVLAIKYGSDDYSISLPGMPKGTVTILGARVASASLVIAAIGLILSLGLILGLRRTRLGIHVRAAGQDPLLASQGGIQVRRLYVGAWGAAGLLATFAGVLYGSTTIVNSSMSTVGILAVPAIILGGLDSFEGAVVGGLAIGIVQQFVSSYWGGQYSEVITYTLLLMVLLVYPRGLFGTADIIRA